jgi:RHS repeat-associated protein
LTDPNNNTTRFEFDSSGRLVQETLATGDQVKYSYSNSNKLVSMTNARGQKREFEYDAAGRLTRWTDTDGSVAYTYDPNGNLLTVKDEKGTISRQYDKLNRVTQYTDTQGNTLKYAFDAVGNLITLTYPDGKQVHYEYDAADQLITVTDWANRVTRYDYDKNGRLISINRPNGTQQSRVYDLAGQLLQQKEVVIKTGKVISQVDFSYDAAGNIIEEKTSREADPQINLEMTYAKANRLASYDDETVQLDADGNLIQGPLSGEMADFVFDSRNRLIQAGDTTYHYDAENQRIGVNQTQYVINSQPALSQVLVKTDASGTQTYYVYGLGLIGQETAGEYTSYHFDLRGSTVALTDESGQVLERFQYSPYGLLVGGEASTTPFLFNGMYGVMTDSNGLYYMRARFYSPEMRRFVNQDVLLGNIAEGQTLNRYAYVTGRPISFVDPFGLESMEEVEFLNLGFLYGGDRSSININIYMPLIDAIMIFNHFYPLVEREVKHAHTVSPKPTQEQMLLIDKYIHCRTACEISRLSSLDKHLALQFGHYREYEKSFSAYIREKLSDMGILSWFRKKPLQAWESYDAVYQECELDRLANATGATFGEDSSKTCQEVCSTHIGRPNFLSDPEL